MGRRYDVIIVGGRCAGAPTAMLLARKGYRALVVDKATFPSDTLSTHIVHPRGVAALAFTKRSVCESRSTSSRNAVHWFSSLLICGRSRLCAQRKVERRISIFSSKAA